MPSNQRSINVKLSVNKTLMSFETGWAIVQGKFNILRDFCGGIATVPANTAEG
jgi:hypothetical protein